MMSFLNCAEASNPSRTTSWADPARLHRQARQGLLISPEATLKNKAVCKDRTTLFLLGIAMILTAGALITSLISLALS